MRMCNFASKFYAVAEKTVREKSLGILFDSTLYTRVPAGCTHTHTFSSLSRLFDAEFFMQSRWLLHFQSAINFN